MKENYSRRAAYDKYRPEPTRTQGFDQTDEARNQAIASFAYAHCAVLAVQLLKERGVKVCAVRRALHRLKLRWRRPRPVPPERNPQEKKQRLLEILRLLVTMPEDEVAIFHESGYLP